MDGEKWVKAVAWGRDGAWSPCARKIQIFASATWEEKLTIKYNPNNNSILAIIKHKIK
jgi:hypothetical protein